MPEGGQPYPTPPPQRRIQASGALAIPFIIRDLLQSGEREEARKLYAEQIAAERAALAEAGRLEAAGRLGFEDPNPFLSARTAAERNAAISGDPTAQERWNALSGPERFRILVNNPSFFASEEGARMMEQLAAGQQDAGDPFTLSAGQTRFDPSGREIANVPPAPRQRNITLREVVDPAGKLRLGRFDESGRLIDFVEGASPQGRADTSKVQLREVVDQESGELRLGRFDPKGEFLGFVPGVAPKPGTGFGVDVDPEGGVSVRFGAGAGGQGVGTASSFAKLRERRGDFAVARQFFEDAKRIVEADPTLSGAFGNVKRKASRVENVLADVDSQLGTSFAPMVAQYTSEILGDDMIEVEARREIEAALSGQPNALTGQEGTTALQAIEVPAIVLLTRALQPNQRISVELLKRMQDAYSFSSGGSADVRTRIDRALDTIATADRVIGRQLEEAGIDRVDFGGEGAAARRTGARPRTIEELAGEIIEDVTGGGGGER